MNLFKSYVVFYRNKNSRIMCWSLTMKKLFDAGIVSQNFPRLKGLLSILLNQQDFIFNRKIFLQMKNERSLTEQDFNL